jgi:hypothetical protein
MEQLQVMYKGNMIKVTPVDTGGRTQFIVHMSSGDLPIEMMVKEGREKSWQEVGTGETDRAKELGSLIEEAEHSQ